MQSVFILVVSLAVHQNAYRNTETNNILLMLLTILALFQTGTFVYSGSIKYLQMCIGELLLVMLLITQQPYFLVTEMVLLFLIMQHTNWFVYGVSIGYLFFYGPVYPWATEGATYLIAFLAVSALETVEAYLKL